MPFEIARDGAAADLPRHPASKLPFDLAGCRILIQSVAAYVPDRFPCGCIAVKLANGTGRN